MTRIKIASSSFFFFIITTGLFVSPAVLADESEDSATRVVRHLYPVVPFLSAKFVAARHNGGISRFADLVALLSVIRAGNELGTVLTESSLALAGVSANAASAAGMMIPALGLSVCGYEATLVDSFVRSSTEQLGNGLRGGLKDNSASLHHLATKYQLPGAHHEHVVDFAKTTAALITLSILSSVDWSSTNRFSDKIGFALTLTSAYLLSESLTEHFRQSAFLAPQASAAGLLSAAGAIGSFLTKRDSMHGSMSQNLLEAGAVTAVNAALQEAYLRLEGDLQAAIKCAVGFAGVWLFVDRPHALDDSVLNRIRRTIAVGLMMPAALATLDWAKDTALHLHWRN